MDGSGEFSRWRQVLHQYPERIRLRRLAEECFLVWPKGEYNFVQRMAKRRDPLAIAFCLGPSVEGVMRLVVLADGDLAPSAPASAVHRPKSESEAMPYHHYGNIGDVWKHLPLCEILGIEHPRTYVETNAAYATYALESTARQQYGVIHAYQHAAESETVAGSRYMAILKAENNGRPEPQTCLGSPALAMAVLKHTAARFVFCDIEADALDSVAAHAASLGLEKRTRTLLGDSVSGTYKLLDTLTADDFLHIDPYLIFEPNVDGLTYFDIFLAATRQGIKCMLWYGYFTVEEEREMDQRFRAAIAADRGLEVHHMNGVEIALDLIQPNSIIVNPGIVACGVLTSNLSAASREAVRELAEGMVAIYKDSTLFGTHSGRLHTRHVDLCP